MASSSYCFVIVSFVVLLVSASSQTSTKPIDAICQRFEGDKAFCYKSLLNYPPAASAKNTFDAAVATLHFVAPFADNFSGLARKAAKENPNLKKEFEECQRHFEMIATEIKGAVSELKDLPGDAYYSASICLDETRIMRELIGKNTDKDSKNIMKLTLKMEQLIRIAIGATEAVQGLKR